MDTLPNVSRQFTGAFRPPIFPPMPRAPRRPPPAPSVERLELDPLPPRPIPGAWPPGAPVPIADRQHRPRKLALALTRASGLLIAVGLTMALLLASPVGTRRQAHLLAARELTSLLAPGERVLAQAAVSQRRPADVWRRSYGLLIATSRRVMHVGAAPLPLLRPIDPGPRDLLLSSWPYGDALSLSGAPEDGGAIRVRTATRTIVFRADEADDARALLAAVADERRPRADAPTDSARPY